MIVKAYQTAFHRGDGRVLVRPIEIPDGEIPSDKETYAVLQLAFYYGQNDFQPVPERYSVSVGDVIELNDGRKFRVMGAGFEELEPGEAPTALKGREACTAGYGF